MTTIDTTRLTPRPVWRRRELRLSGELVHLPTEGEIEDALYVLREGIQPPLGLYVEAETIFVEAHEQRIVSEGEFRARLQTFDG